MAASAKTWSGPAEGDAARGEAPPPADGTKQVLRIEEITVDAGTLVRAAIDAGTVEAYAEHLKEGGTFLPVTVFEHETSRHLATGFHRLEHTTPLAGTRWRSTCSREDALWCALGANRAHGQRLSAADKERAIGVALGTSPDRSQRRIAKQIGCAPSNTSARSRGR